MRNIKYIEIPNTCPVCRGKTEIKQDNDSKVLVCTNSNCEGKLLNRLIYFCSKPAMNIEGLSEATLEKFIDLGFINDFLDIYYLNDYKDEIINLDGFGEKSYNNLITSIEKSKNVKLENFITALSISNIGKTASKTISKYFSGEWGAFYHALENDFDFTQLEDFGQIMNHSLHAWFYNHDKDDLNYLIKQINFTKSANIDKKTNQSILSGFKIYCTGSFASHKKEELKQIIESLGGEFASGYAKSLDYLVVGSLKGSGKEDKAKADGVKILSEDEFLKMIGEK